MLAKQLVTVEVKVTHDRDIDSQLRESIPNGCDGGGGFARVDGDAHDFGARACECLDLLNGAFDIGRVSVRHRLHDNGCSAADSDGANRNLNGFSTWGCHKYLSRGSEMSGLYSTCYDRDARCRGLSGESPVIDRNAEGASFRPETLRQQDGRPQWAPQ